METRVWTEKCIAFEEIPFIILFLFCRCFENLYTVQGRIYPVQTVKCNIILYNLIERKRIYL